MEWLALMIYCFFYALLLCIGVYAHHHWGIRIVCSFRLSKLVHGPLVGGNAMAIFCSQSVTAHSHCFLPLYLHGTTRNSKYFLGADSFSYITLWIADCEALSSFILWRQSCASEPVGWTFRDQEKSKGDLWAFTPAAQISRTGVQLRTAVVVGTVIMRVSRAELGQEVERSAPLWVAGTAV